MNKITKVLIPLIVFLTLQKQQFSQTCSYPGPNLIVNGNFEGTLTDIPGMTYLNKSATTSTPGIFAPCSGGAIDAGGYAFSNRATECGFMSNWIAIDHTYQDSVTERLNWNLATGAQRTPVTRPKGTFLIVDSKNGKSVAYTRTVTVCPGTVYKFSFWAKNLVRSGSVSPAHTDPSVGIAIGTPTAAATYTALPFRTNYPSLRGVADWVQFSGTYSTSVAQTTLDFNIMLNGTSSEGGDLGIDDVSFSTCSYSLDAATSNFNIGGTGPGCSPSVTFSANVSKDASDAKSYAFTWLPSASITAPSSATLTNGTNIITHTVNPTPVVTTIYTVEVVRDGCATSKQTATLAINVFNASVTATKSLTCYGDNNGTATITAVDGAQPYTYAWIGSASTSSVGTGLAAGPFTVAVTSSNNCVFTFTGSVASPSQITPTINVTPARCNGTSTGSLSISSSGGTGPYTYTLTSSSNPTYSTGATPQNLPAGNYTVTAKDFNGCTATQTVAVTQPTLLTASISSSLAVSCNGLSTGSVTGAAADGNGGYTYRWASSTNTSVSTASTATALASGGYTLTVTDSKSCTAVASVTITQPSALIVSTTGSLAVSCFGASTGSVSSSVSGGNTGGYTYNWASSANTSVSTSSTAIGISSGIYTLTVTDTKSCSSTATVNITQPTVLTAAINSSLAVSCNGLSTGSVTGSGSGGTSPYTYKWNSGSNASVSTASTATSLSAGNYTLTVTDNNLCTAIKTVNISEPAVLTASISSNLAASCFGTSTGSLSGATTGGNGGNTYIWASSTNTNISTSFSVTGLATGNYTLTVTDSKACTAVVSASVTQPNLLVASTINNLPVTCNGLSTGSVTGSGSGGTSPYTYIWNSGSNPSVSTSSTAISLSAGNYTLTVTDKNLCTATKSITIVQPNALIAATNGSLAASCYGTSTGSVSSNVTGGNGGYTYNWVSSSNISVSTNSVATGLAAGNYTLTVIDSKLCTATATVSITQPVALTATLTSNTPTTCAGFSNGALTVSASGGNTNYTYAWTPNVSTTTTATGLPANGYTVTVTDNKFCSVTVSKTITSIPTDNSKFNYTGGTFCSTGSNQTPTITGLTGGTFSSTPSGLTIDPVTGVITTTASALANYTVSYKTNGPCPSTSTVAITITDAPKGDFKYSGPYCTQGNNPTPTFIGASSGGLFTSAPGLSLTPSTGMINLSSSTSGTYTVFNTIAPAGGCAAATGTAVVVLFPVPNASVVTNFSVACYGATTGSLNISVTDGTPKYKYKWTPDVSSSNTAYALAAGTYSVLITDVNTCTTTISAAIAQPTAPLTSSVTVLTATTCTGLLNGAIAAEGLGGTAPYTYSWSPGSISTATASNLAGGTYSVTITDFNGCNVSDFGTISTLPIDNSSFTYNGSTFCSTGANQLPTKSGTSSGNFSVTPAGLQIDLTTGEIFVSTSSLNTYTVSYYTNGACPSTSTVQVKITDSPKAHFIYNGPYCTNATNPSPKFILSGSGGLFTSTSGLSISGSTGVIELLKSKSGIYTVENTIVASGGCPAAKATATVTINDIPVVNVGANKELCSTDSVMIGSTVSSSITSIWSSTPAGFTSTNSVAYVKPTNTTVYNLTQVNSVTQCSAAASVTVAVNPSPIVDTLGLVKTDIVCGQGSGSISGIKVKSGTNPINFTWKDESGKVVGNEIDLENIGVGKYTLTLLDGKGCKNTEPVSPIAIRSTGSVVATFTADPLSGQNPLLVNFTNLSVGATSYIWDFGTGDSAKVMNSSYTFKDLGQYKTCLTVKNSAGCIDSSCIMINVYVNSVFVIPNVFTPNNDGNNDIFKVKSVGLKTLDVEIFNRWGQKMYEYHTIEGGWDGITPNGQLAPDGTYFYFIKGTGVDGKEYPGEGKVTKGSFNLFR